MIPIPRAASLCAARSQWARARRPARWLAASILCLQAAASPQAAEPGLAAPQQVYQLALEARTARDYASMLALLRQAAGAGDRPAQELLASVLLAGPALYGAAVPADVCEAAHWVRRAAAQGSEISRHQAIVLNGLRDGPRGGGDVRDGEYPCP